MSVASAWKPFISVDDYLAGEPFSEVRHEYIDGQVYAMTGASRTHGLIVNALAFALTPAARSKRCQLFTSDMKVRLEVGGKTIFYYPDLMLSCDPQDRESHYSHSPCLIVEVLSESTARIDRREKLLAYQSMPSLKAYVLVEQDAMRVESYRRTNDWRVEYQEQGEVWIDCLDVALPLTEIYRDVQAL